MAELGKTARYYKSHPKARRVKAKYDTEYHSSDERKKYRAKLNRERRRRRLKGSDKDLSHTESGKLVLEDRSKNRARNNSGNNGRLKKD